MGLPSQKRTKSSARRRASHFALKKPSVNVCTNCQASILPHTACPKCGYFKGEKKIAVKTKSK
ncbi:50S ribosomal protein L32 [Patescibacteria group bacterium]|jgi:large subunit ribosomal protein L32|nr:50S ribosomal protein L32 [Patescibacteria group bacterium]